MDIPQPSKRVAGDDMNDVCSELAYFTAQQSPCASKEGRKEVRGSNRL